MLDAYIELKTEDVRRLNTTTHPVEFDMYYTNTYFVKSLHMQAFYYLNVD